MHVFYCLKDKNVSFQGLYSDDLTENTKHLLLLLIQEKVYIFSKFLKVKYLKFNVYGQYFENTSKYEQLSYDITSWNEMLSDSTIFALAIFCMG